MFKYIIIGCFCLYMAVFLIFCYKSHHFFKTLLLNVIIGIIALVSLNLLAGYTKLPMNINKCTVITSASLGIPGILTVLALNMFF